MTDGTKVVIGAFVLSALAAGGAVVFATRSERKNAALSATGTPAERAIAAGVTQARAPVEQEAKKLAIQPAVTKVAGAQFQAANGLAPSSAPVSIAAAVLPQKEALPNLALLIPAVKEALEGKVPSAEGFREAAEKVQAALGLVNLIAPAAGAGVVRQAAQEALTAPSIGKGSPYVPSFAPQVLQYTGGFKPELQRSVM